MLSSRLKLAQLIFRGFWSENGLKTLTNSAIKFQNSSKFMVRNLSCWKCERQLPDNQFFLQCPNCRTLQKIGGPESVNFFNVFNIQETYRVDLSKLSAEMKVLQKNLHPDLFSLKTKEEQELSENLSSLVNKAYAVLQDPMERAEYLLKLRGIDEQMMEKKMTADIEFLGEVMELNERLEAIDDAESWAAFREENNEKIKILTRDLEEAFTAENIGGAVLILSKLKYYDNLQKKLKDVQRRLGIVD